MCSEILLARVCLHRGAKGNMKKQTPNHPLLRQLWFLKPIFPRGLSYVYVYSHTIGGKCPKNVSHPSYCATLHLQILTVHRNQRSAYAWERGQNGFSFSGKEEVGERNRRRERERERERERVCGNKNRRMFTRGKNPTDCVNYSQSDVPGNLIRKYVIHHNAATMVLSVVQLWYMYN